MCRKVNSQLEYLKKKKDITYSVIEKLPVNMMDWNDAEDTSIPLQTHGNAE